MNRAVVRTIAVSIVLIILFFTMFPSPDAIEAGPMCVICGDRGLADAILNVVMFVPLGLAIGLLTHPGRAIVSGIALSSGIELAQVWVPGRHPSLGDVGFNVLGAVLGTLLLLAVVRAWRLRPRTALVLAALAALAGIGVLRLGVRLLEPARLESSAYYGQWTPRFFLMAYYDGSVLAASIDSLELPSTRIEQTAALEERLRADAPLDLIVRAGTPPPAVAPVFALAGGEDVQVMMVGAHHDQLVYRYRTRGNAIQLDSPDLRVYDGLAHVQPGDTVRIRVAPRAGDRRIAITVDGRTTVVRHSALDTWGLLYWSEMIGMQPGLRRLVGMAWVTAILAPALFLGFVALLRTRHPAVPFDR